MILIDGYSYTSQTRQAPSVSPSNTNCWKGLVGSVERFVFCDR